MLKEHLEFNTLDASGFPLRYRIEGDGIPAIVVGSALYYPRTFSQNLREHLRLIFMDHRGFASAPDRPCTQADYELDVLVDDIERLRQTLGLGRIVIIGHSGHAYMALEYAKKYPQHVSHVVMIGIIPNLSAKSHELAEQFWQDTATPERKAALIESEQRLPDTELAALSPSQRFIQQYIRSSARIWYDYHYDATALWEQVEINMDIFTYVWGTVFRDMDITRGLDTLTTPVFLALGKYDYLAPYSLWSPEILASFNHLTVHLFEKSGHTPSLEEQSLFDTEFLRWLLTLTPAPSPES